ncbi:hypothetical protein [Rickettsia rickettsii]|uniref:Uncharacterized protein n=2 Tax=Rickettsia rickettsii TaxID=783 RepID=B0BY14_RICRO|nr:hypothetical protein [Rickettsia rickettsii]ABV76374.1 hypothetical protein A1G_04350 [Rickettsia rickettsii str. 'Sheila Smith']ABY72740.1 hypothetical protein RrIowa_0914 [Rickettsia rickettsii str. Iowa]AFB22051.1 hypothetical protein RPN_02625 [Rickettsia rickettsii str. Brazil]AFB23719.1 hypothetical protein RPL_04315 [Rickettsia rickettsii str. Colombia]AFB25068.1 hypothetical protein RPO_04335 [Rickettsia rickettsii str. Arizona]
MLKNFILVLLCISSYKSLGESNKTENNVSAIERKKVSSNDKQLKPVYLEHFDLTSDLNPTEKSLLSLESLSPNNNNTKPIIVDIQENFEGLDRVKGDDIRTARQRELVQNSLLGDFLGGFISRPPPTILGEKIQDRRRLYIQQTKAKKSPK